MGTGDDWEDVLGTGTVMKQVLSEGQVMDQDLDMEAPRKFFALIDIETKCNGKPIVQESHKNFLINVDADLFPGAHLVIPLMNIGEISRYKFHSKFCYAEHGNPPEIGPNSELECIIKLTLRSSYDDFLNELTSLERIRLGQRKKERGKFWFGRSNYQMAITIYNSLVDLCQLDSSSTVQDDGGDGVQ